MQKAINDIVQQKESKGFNFLMSVFNFFKVEPCEKGKVDL